MTDDAIGLDIGGANIKVATTTGQAHAWPFELWRQPERLTNELRKLAEHVGSATVAITMTGELCDCFATKADGVRHIVLAVEDAFATRTRLYWTTHGTFVPANEALADPWSVAAANWLATACDVARTWPDATGVLIDTGSTTTDVIPFHLGHAIPEGRTDPARMASSELVYTGVKRTPVCALLGETVAAEWFATTHDVYVRLGLLPEEPTNTATADGRPMTQAHAHARLSRMYCDDATMDLGRSQELAEEAFRVQRERIAAAITHVSRRLPRPPSVLVVAGSGEFLAHAACQRAFPDVAVQSLAAHHGAPLSEAAAAFAVARLAQNR